jgi:alpha-galactosidase
LRQRAAEHTWHEANMQTRIAMPIVLVILAVSLSSACQGGESGAATGGWVEAAFGGEAPAPALAPGLNVLRQDFGVLRLRRSVMDTALKIGAKSYTHGLGTHAVSHIEVRLPKAAKTFGAEVGIDNNYDTAGSRGSVIFIVELAGKEVFRSAVLRGGQPPLPVKVDLAGAKEFVLRVLDDGDGPAYDQSDWAEACVMTESGDRAWLDDLAIITKAEGFSKAVPVSFVYGGKPSSELLPAWKRTEAKAPAEAGRERRSVTWADPATGLEVTAEITLFADSPAVEWVLYFKNAGAADTPMLENILALDLKIGVPEKGEVVLHHAKGSTCAADDFLPIDQPMAPGATVNLAPAGGRSSNGQLPFFNLQWQGGGVVGAIGWSGQWAMKVQRAGGTPLALQAGQQTTHLVLHQGEAIRTPRVLLVPWQGADPLRGHNLLRRLMLTHYVPRINGQIVLPPVTHNGWFTFNQGNEVNEKNQLELIAAMAPSGVEVYWLDAGWFEGGWPSGVGSWAPRADAFPRGLAPLGEAAHKAGMKFIVWFEPERVHPASRIGKEHPEWVLQAGGGDGLFNLGDPAAREWLTDYLVAFLEKSGIDVYRNDLNIDPLGFWRAADKADRQGMAEIRYVEGLYRMWDDLRRRRPGLWIDNCASGGRRIDLETCSRSLPLWRSDTQCCGRAEPVQDQVQTAGLSLYVPLHSAGCWGFDPYVFRSVATTGTNLCMDPRPKDYPMSLSKAAIAEAKALRPCHLGDYYPLLPITTSDRDWCGWQLDRTETGGGCAVFFRRAGSPYAAVDAALRGLDPAGAYEVTFFETYQAKDKKRMSGKDLGHLRVEVPAAPGSLLVTYRKVQ